MSYAPPLDATVLPPPPLPHWLQETVRPAPPLTEACPPPPALSFELFPPRAQAPDTVFWASIRRFERLSPAFVSVTYGAGGSTQARTQAVVERIARETSLTPAAHLTAVGATRAEVDAVARRYWDAGIRHIVALRGDMPGGARYQPHPDGYAYAADLVAGLKRIADFEISVAAYPETHPEAQSPAADLDNLRRKFDAGATRAITQYFFAAETFLRFLDRARAAGITAPIVPGILPITNFAQAVKFSAACGGSIPPWLGRLFEGLDDDPETRRMVAAVVATEQVRMLQANGIGAFHLYTLNRPELVSGIAQVLGIRPRGPQGSGQPAG